MKPALTRYIASPKSLLILVFLFSIAAVSAIAEKIPDSAWQTGTLRSVTSDTHSRVFGMYNNGQGMVGEKIRIVTHYTIESAQYIYQADRTTNRHGKPLNVTINAPVTFAIEEWTSTCEMTSAKFIKWQLRQRR